MVSCVASNLSRAPSFTDYQLCCLHTKVGNVLIGGVWHIHSVNPLGDAKLLNHYGGLTKYMVYDNLIVVVFERVLHQIFDNF